MKNFHVYIMAAKRNGTLYTRVTGNLAARVFEHKNDVNEGFIKGFGVHMLVYYEHRVRDANTGIRREKQMKNLHQAEKIRPACGGMNLHWKDLYDDLTSEPGFWLRPE